jgi:hypothetical protein
VYFNNRIIAWYEMVIIISTTIYYLVCILTKKCIAFLSNAEEAKEKAYD